MITYKVRVAMGVAVCGSMLVVLNLSDYKWAYSNNNTSSVLASSVTNIKEPDTLVHKRNTTNNITFEFRDLSVYSTIQKIRAEFGYDVRKNETCKQRTPSCIIIGVKKCGTRELTDFMHLHPNIIIKTDPYEIGYFARHRDKGIGWFREQMPCSYSNQITVTKYPWYLSDPVAAEHIHSYNKTIRLIVLVREPVQRLISGYTFSHNNRRTRYKNTSNTLPIEKYLFINKGTINVNYEEIKLSTYDEGLNGYLKYFSLEQILFIEFNELKNHPLTALRKVETHLGLDHVISEENFVYNEEKNFYCVRFHGNGSCYSNMRGRVNQPDLKETTLERLKKYFKPHNEHLFKMIGKRYDW